MGRPPTPAEIAFDAVSRWDTVLGASLGKDRRGKPSVTLELVYDTTPPVVLAIVTAARAVLPPGTEVVAVPVVPVLGGAKPSR